MSLSRRLVIVMCAGLACQAGRAEAKGLELPLDRAALCRERTPDVHALRAAVIADGPRKYRLSLHASPRTSGLDGTYAEVRLSVLEGALPGLDQELLHGFFDGGMESVQTRPLTEVSSRVVLSVEIVDCQGLRLSGPFVLEVRGPSRASGGSRALHWAISGALLIASMLLLLRVWRRRTLRA